MLLLLLQVCFRYNLGCLSLFFIFYRPSMNFQPLILWILVMFNSLLTFLIHCLSFIDVLLVIIFSECQHCLSFFFTFYLTFCLTLYRPLMVIYSFYFVSTICLSYYYPSFFELFCLTSCLTFFLLSVFHWWVFVCNIGFFFFFCIFLLLSYFCPTFLYVWPFLLNILSFFLLVCLTVS